MGIALKPCRYCGKPFRPCATKIGGMITWRRIWCSPECYQNSLRDEMTVASIEPESEVVKKVTKKKTVTPVVEEETHEEFVDSLSQD